MNGVAELPPGGCAGAIGLWGGGTYFPRRLGARGEARRGLRGATLMRGRLVTRSGGCRRRRWRGMTIILYGEDVGALWPLLPFSWVRRGQPVEDDGQAGDVWGVAETIRRTRPFAGVAGDVLRQVSKEGSDDVVFAQVGGVVSFSDLHVEVRDLYVVAAGDGGDTLVEVVFWSALRHLLDEDGDHMLLHDDMEGVNRAIESLESELSSLQGRQ
ncbi:hypothetical protein ACSSS7_006337 [Eimeria intestinalis]